ncbi:MAG: heptaprenyl diphosphate synthase component 1 [Vulcanibacillus sp.]
MKAIYSSFCIEMEEISSEIKDLSQEMYIEKHISIPEISVIPLQLLNLYLFHANVPKFLRKKYCTTSGLINLGLDMHDLVTNQKELDELRIKNRQMSVLAGDYFSSICYLLLAKEGLFKKAGHLAIGISGVTTAKMELYNLNNGKNFNSVEQIYDLIKIRESNLYIQFLDELKSAELILFWKSIIENIVMFFLLLDETKAENIKLNNFSYYLLNYYTSSQEIMEIERAQSMTEVNNKIKLLYHKYNINFKLEELLANTYYNINSQINCLEDTFIQEALLCILKSCNSTQYRPGILEKI